RTADRPARPVAARGEETPTAPCRGRGSLRRYLAQPLEDKAPAVALRIERLVGVRARATRLLGDPGSRGERALVVRVDVGHGHADVLALHAAALRADRGVGTLRADPDHAVAELDERVVEHAVGAFHPRARDLVEPERALQERERGSDVRIRKLGNDGWSPRGSSLLLDRRHERRLSPVEHRRLERGLAPQLLRQVDRIHRFLSFPFPFGSSSSRRRVRARLSRERTGPPGRSRAAANGSQGRSPPAKSRRASRSGSGRASIASATRGNSTRASSAAAPARRSGTSREAANRALARSRRASVRRCFSSTFEPIPYSHGSALAREASKALRRSN